MSGAFEEDKLKAVRNLEIRLANGCADDITEVMVDLKDGTCDHVELISLNHGGHAGFDLRSGSGG
jgi:hypothetical protein